MRCPKPPGLPSRWRGRGAVGLPSETELIRGAFLLEEEPGHAGRRQSSCQCGGLLVRACLPQPVQQAAAMSVTGSGAPGGSSTGGTTTTTGVLVARSTA